MSNAPTTRREIWEKAVESPNGLVIEVESRAAAVKFRHLLYNARQVERNRLEREFGVPTPCKWDRYVVLVRQFPGEKGPLYKVIVVPEAQTLRGIKITDPLTGEPI